MQQESSQAKRSGGNNVLHRDTPLAEEERTVLLHSLTVPLLSNEPQTPLLFVDTTYYSFITLILQGTHNCICEDKDILYLEELNNNERRAAYKSFLQRETVENV